METFNQIIAVTSGFNNLIWDNDKSDFVSFENEVKSTDAEDIANAIAKAKQCSNIIQVFEEVIDCDTQSLLHINKIYNRLTDEA